MNQKLQLVKDKLKQPSKFAVILLNDDYTTMDFVIKVLQKFFAKSKAEANAITLQIHNYGEGICGEYSYDIAQTKAEQVIAFAKNNEHPLMCIIRKIK